MKKYLFLFAIAAIAVISCNNTNASASKDIADPDSVSSTKNTAAEILPTFKIVDLSGKPFNLGDFKGKKVFVNLWASWCGPCRAEMPSIESLYNKVDKTKAVFVMLSLDDDFETAVKFAKKHKIATPVYYPAETLPAVFDVPGIPATFIFDEKGELITKIEGGYDYDSKEMLGLFNK